MSKILAVSMHAVMLWDCVPILIQTRNEMALTIHGTAAYAISNILHMAILTHDTTHLQDTYIVHPGYI